MYEGIILECLDEVIVLVKFENSIYVKVKMYFFGMR